MFRGLIPDTGERNGINISSGIRVYISSVLHLQPYILQCRAFRIIYIKCPTLAALIFRHLEFKFLVPGCDSIFRPIAKRCTGDEVVANIIFWNFAIYLKSSNSRQIKCRLVCVRIASLVAERLRGRL